MQDGVRQLSEIWEPTRMFLQSACEGDIETIRTRVQEGFNLNGKNEHGNLILATVINDLEFVPQVPKYEVVQDLLRLGANPRLLDSDGIGPLFAAVLNMDTEMLRILLDAGADPNLEKVDSDYFQSLYDWALWDYRYEIWVIDEPDGDCEIGYRKNPDERLVQLDRLAIQHGKRRPDHLQLLRERGALTMVELRYKYMPCNFLNVGDGKHIFDLRLESSVIDGKDSECEQITLYSQIWINDTVVDEMHFIDLPALIQSLHVDGCFEIFTCGCAIWGCAGIPEAVQVTHEGDDIRWRCCAPLSSEYMLNGEELSYGFDPNRHVGFFFTHAQVVASIENFLETIRELVGTDVHRYDWPVDGMDVPGVLAIDIGKPYFS